MAMTKGFWPPDLIDLALMHLMFCRALFVAVSLAVVAPAVAWAEPSPVGTWDVAGRDQSGTNWSATLFLEPLDKDEYPPARLKGFFDWDGSNKTGGREYVVLATYDYETRELILQGSDLEDADPNIRMATYTVSMTKEADKLVDGKWTGDDLCPGVWEATRSLEQPTPRKRSRSTRIAEPAPARCKDGRCPSR